MTKNAIIALAAAVSSLAIAAPSSAATLIDASLVGMPISVTYNGLTDGGVVLPGLTAAATFTLTSFTGTTANFDWTLENTSGSPFATSRISGFGFNLSPNPTGGTGSTPFTVVGSGNLPNFGGLDICFKSDGGSANCAGGGGGGIDQGGSASGTFALNFGSALSSFTIDDYTVRYQSLTGVNGVNSAIGVGTPGLVPEPATWGMMILGIGLVGGVMRRRRTAVSYNFA